MSVARYYSPTLRKKLLRGEQPEWLKRHPRRSYIVACCLASVAWGDHVGIKLMRAWARAMTIFTGVPHVLDHDIPLTHPHVCGLSVAWNFRVVPYDVNASKGNDWYPDQMALL